MKKISIVIPVFNEVSTVKELLTHVLGADVSGLEKEIIVVESNSTDGSRDAVINFAKEHKDTSQASLKVFLEENPKGKGHAVRTGLIHCTGDIILIQDADLEYSVKDYPLLLEPILTEHSNFVLGSRHLSAGSWKIRKFDQDPIRSIIMNLGGIFFHGFFNLVYGQKLTDPTTMYKVFNRDCLKKFDLVSNRFDFDYELVAKLIRSGNPPLEVPVSYVSRGYEEGKKVRFFQDPLTWVKAILKFRFAPLKTSNSTRSLSHTPAPMPIEDVSTNVFKVHG